MELMIAPELPADPPVGGILVVADLDAVGCEP